MTTQAQQKNRKRTPKRPQAELFDRQPPFNLEAEVGVLGSLMLMPETCDEIVNILRPADFFDESHSKLFQHIMDMHGAGKKINMLLLRERLMASGDYEAVGALLGWQRFSLQSPMRLMQLSTQTSFAAKPPPGT